MSNVDETYRKINRFDDLDIFSRARLMNTGEYDEYLQERELETYKQALLNIKEKMEQDVDFNDDECSNEYKIGVRDEAKETLWLVNQALGDKE